MDQKYLYLFHKVTEAISSLEELKSELITALQVSEELYLLEDCACLSCENPCDMWLSDFSV